MFFRVFDSVFSATAFAVPKSQNSITGFNDTFVTADWRTLCVRFIIGFIYFCREVMRGGETFRQSINAFSPSTYNSCWFLREFLYVVANIHVNKAPAADYSKFIACFHILNC